jgi:hypothetical protein
MDASITELDSLGVTPFLASRKPGGSRGSDLGKNHVILDNRPGELPNPVAEPSNHQGTTHLPSPSLQLGAFPLALHFAKSHDRFVHSIDLMGESARRELLRSVPGDNSDPWPADAPLQQVVLESIRPESSPIAFGVGLSGHGHWSLACEVLTGDTPGFQLDFACKASSPPGSLSSCYRLIHQDEESNIPDSQSLHGVSVSESCCRITTALELTNTQCHGCLIVEVQRGRIEYHPDTATLWIRPSEPLDRAGTYRWCYSIRWEAS